MLYVNITKKLDNITLKSEFTTDGGVSALFGASGAGKSMTLKCIAGIEKPDSGVIQLDGKTLFDSEKHINLKPQQRNVGYLFQEYALFPNMTVSGNIKASMHSLKKDTQKKILDELLERFHLNGLENKRPSALSGGEQQRTALARIFASSPKVLLLDEPFSSLDDLLKIELIPYIKEILTSFIGDTVLVSHNISEVLQLSDRVTPIQNGATQKTVAIDSFYSQIKDKYKNAGLLLPYNNER